MGVWNAHTSIGNMLGSLIGAAMIHYTMDGGGWPWAFTVPAVTALVMAVATSAFLVPHPSDVGLAVEEEPEGPPDVTLPADGGRAGANNDINNLSARSPSAPASASASAMAGFEVSAADVDADGTHVTFFTALFIPGVVEFSLALFFCKLVAYTFLFWLPYYLTTFYDSGMASYLSIYFDMGGIVGGIIAGLLADKFKKPAIISVSAMIICMPVLLGYRTVSEHAIGGVAGNILVMFILGAFVNGPYALITTAVSADLGNHPTLGSDASALATVSGIVDGMGTLGAAAQGVLVSLVSSAGGDKGQGQTQNWDAVFFMLIACCGVAALCLSRLLIREFKEVLAQRLRGHAPRSSSSSSSRRAEQRKEQMALMAGSADTDTELEADHVAMVLDKYKRRPVVRP
jgi:OPA family glycerol-3-phosphate transporter-like MFS transporter 1/2